MYIATSANPTYEYYCYDNLTNLCLNYKDNCIVLNRGLTIYPEISNEIGVICKNDSSIFEPIDINKRLETFLHPNSIIKWIFFLHSPESGR